ncbi:MAG: hypothetical protein IKQ46_06410 [Bacteroidales bacterium]|jgi:hypothetical protein|nr:hypothetical protein [Bacteroidales bacterium]
MNKILSFLLALTVSLGISSCFSGNGNDVSKDNITVNEIDVNNETPLNISPDNIDIPQNNINNALDNNINNVTIEQNGTYTSKNEVALYIHTFNKLPKNYIKKSKAQALGWESSKGNLQDVAPGKSIGGDRFGNYEGLLPKAKGRQYYECDIDYTGGRRNAKRIIFSNDGLVYYTNNHYKSFEQIY